ncbi:hypothetical protein FVEN_g12773 [Fusarium venenatum]|uniref:Uncharacterized protein n=1 Tax=Fusarium venenatum TaxID=56646 RepID=A0A2L2TB19_9HYPO|nr:uncharacterized protein FVRRES_11403 [Fusarium venenatum]KAG8357422.1 hypothetical protein FVEN_g12773 [Fusarium venenatum]CEI38712.1 unnamed protein product [Fusarium venenatum]
MGSRYFLVEAAHRISSSTRNLFRQPSRITVLTPLPPLPRAMQRSNPELHKFVSEANKRVVTNEEFMANNEKLIANHKKYNNEQKWIDILLWPGAILGTLASFLTSINKALLTSFSSPSSATTKMNAQPTIIT